MEIKLEGFGDGKYDHKIKTKLEFGIWQSVKLGMGVVIGSAIGITIIWIVATILGFSILNLFPKSPF
jgi:hypothetical protein